MSKHSAHKLGLHICMKNNGRVRSVVRLNKIPFYNLLARHKQVPRAVGDCEARVVAGIHGLNYLADHVIMLVRCVCMCVCWNDDSSNNMYASNTPSSTLLHVGRLAK